MELRDLPKQEFAAFTKDIRVLCTFAATTIKAADMGNAKYAKKEASAARRGQAATVPARKLSGASSRLPLAADSRGSLSSVRPRNSIASRTYGS